MRQITRPTGSWPIPINLGCISVLVVSALLVVLPARDVAAQSDQGSASTAAPHAPAPSATLSKPIKAKASWYGPGFGGHETSTGQRYNPHKLTAASSKIPLGSTAEVKNLKNGRKVRVKVNDCGPDVAGRKVDLSSRAANDLKMKHSGVVPVEVKVLHKPPDAQPCAEK